MSVDQWIQIGMLFLAGVPIAAYAAKRWIYDRQFGVRLDARLHSENGAYVREIKIFAAAPPVVTLVAVWVRVQAVNNSSSKAVITSLSSCEAGANPRQAVDFDVEDSR
jgi:hypothetical protein